MTLSYENISSVRATGEADRAKVFDLVSEFPFRTARELAHKVSSDVISHDSIHKRLPELRQQGKVVNGDVRTCTITGKRAMTWVKASY